LKGKALSRLQYSKDTTRPKLEEMLRFVREGDVVIVHSLDRLARNLDDLRHLVQGFTSRGIRVEFVKEGLTFTGEDSPKVNKKRHLWHPLPVDNRFKLLSV
jgi:DNA invertase Pin-like site-specific DNA recombinase